MFRFSPVTLTVTLNEIENKQAYLGLQLTTDAGEVIAGEISKFNKPMIAGGSTVLHNLTGVLLLKDGLGHIPKAVPVFIELVVDAVMVEILSEKGGIGEEHALISAYIGLDIPNPPDKVIFDNRFPHILAVGQKIELNENIFVIQYLQ